jgi:hypothetical protein
MLRFLKKHGVNTERAKENLKWMIASAILLCLTVLYFQGGV